MNTLPEARSAGLIQNTAHFELLGEVTRETRLPRKRFVVQQPEETLNTIFDDLGDLNELLETLEDWNNILNSAGIDIHEVLVQ